MSFKNILMNKKKNLGLGLLLSLPNAVLASGSNYPSSDLHKEDNDSPQVRIEKSELQSVTETDQFWLGATARISPWMAAWQQKSTAAKRFGRDALKVDYSIDTTLILASSFSVRIHDFTFDLEVMDKTESEKEGEKALSYLSSGFKYAGIGDSLAFEFGYLRGRFNGLFNAEANDGREGVSKFSTDLVVQDYLLLHDTGFGLGYRFLNYELPQDVYLVHRSQPNNVLLSGFENFEYRGDFAQALMRSDDRVVSANQASHTGVNFSYELRLGYGVIEPGGKYLETAESANGKLMDKGKSYFYELDVAFYRVFEYTSRRSVRLDLGYRASFLNAEFNAGSEYSLVTDFETSFKGPYFTLAGSF